jgi:hypothetical protein
MPTIVARTQFDSFGDPLNVTITSTGSGASLITAVKVEDAYQPVAVSCSAGSLTQDNTEPLTGEDAYIHRRFAVGSGITQVTFDPSGTGGASMAGTIEEWTGIDSVGVTINAGGTGTTVDDAYTTANANEGAFANLYVSLNTTFSPQAGYTATPGSGSNWHYAIDDNDVGTAGSKNIGGTLGTSVTWGMVGMTYYAGTPADYKIAWITA